MNKARFLISLDFELHWGRVDRYSIEEGKERYKGALEAIPRILEVFEKYKIKATWATVGSLFAENWDEWENYKPEIEPSYVNKKVCPYSQLPRRRQDEASLFAPHIIHQILQSPGQEVGSHTFSHFCVKEAGVSSHEFLADLQAAKNIAKQKFDLDFYSLVFPRNQFDQTFIELAFDNGFQALRTNPRQWIWRHTENDHLLKKIVRTLDSYFELFPKIHTDFEIVEKGILIESTRFFKPNGKVEILNQLKLNRIIDDMSTIAENGGIYHLWWHPHNFGLNIENNIAMLVKIIEHFKILENKFNFNTINMNEFVLETYKNKT